MSNNPNTYQNLSGKVYADLDPKEKEPALKVGGYTSSVAGILSVILALFPNVLTERQALVVLVIASIVLPLVTAAFTRGQVWSPASVKELLDEALEEAKKLIEKKDEAAKIQRRLAVKNYEKAESLQKDSEEN
jgi:hypothetical protein